ncbi:MAG TPA: dephospho-CoA kinase [Candidatus Methylomirabilis sp.]|nr:dephospho-CoA kinase [Candidatus Methylomirabilis sp.]
MLVVGLTGGIATGKSTVAGMFALQGAAIVDADRIAHDLQEPGRTCYREIVEVFGTEILDRAGRIDRRALGVLVFADPLARRRLEGIMHPAIREACQVEIRAAEAAGRAVCLVDAALILEAGQRHRYQKIVLVTAPEEVQLARLVQGRGLTLEEARQRLRAQWPTPAKAAFADFIIDNSGDRAATETQVAGVYAALMGCACGKDAGPSLPADVGER